jgi:hypothetical protein
LLPNGTEEDQLKITRLFRHNGIADAKKALGTLETVDSNEREAFPTSERHS